MNLQLRLLTKEEVDLFNKADEEAFNVHDRYFPDGIVPGAAEDDHGEYDLRKVIIPLDARRLIVLSVRSCPLAADAPHSSAISVPRTLP